MVFAFYMDDYAILVAPYGFYPTIHYVDGHRAKTLLMITCTK